MAGYRGESGEPEPGVPSPSYEELVVENEQLRLRVAELERLVEESRRAGKRQAAPFSKDVRVPVPKKPGRRGGAEYGKWATRGVPERVDRLVEVPLPSAYPHCGAGKLSHLEVVDQYQEEIEARTVVTCFRIQVGSCDGCGARIQPRHAEQASDAWGAAGSGIGPGEVGLAAFLHTVASWYLHRLAATDLDPAIMAGPLQRPVELAPIAVNRHQPFGAVTLAPCTRTDRHLYVCVPFG
ncbi:MAG: hypothetical protein ACRDVM_01955 [Acidimicrobiia bacterium]